MSIGTAPRPLLSRRAEAQLGVRHREVLDQLEERFLLEGSASTTVAELAATVGCSRRTLYEIAPSKDELVLVVLDRFLHRVGRKAIEGIDRSRCYADQIRTYFSGAIELQRLTTKFAADLDDDPGARRLLDRHFRYVMSVTEGLVAAGVATGEFRAVPPGIVAAILAGSGLFTLQPAVLDDLQTTQDAATAQIADLVLHALCIEPQS